jgi:Domain of Unknown Function (DUF1080)
VLQPGQWYEYEIQVQNDSYTVKLGNVVQGQNTTFQQVSSFTKPQGKYTGRGLPPSADPHSGHIALQAHTGPLAFRNVRIRTL